MKYTTCAHCEHKMIEDKYSACPFCGYPACKACKGYIHEELQK